MVTMGANYWAVNGQPNSQQSQTGPGYTDQRYCGAGQGGSILSYGLLGGQGAPFGQILSTGWNATFLTQTDIGSSNQGLPGLPGQSDIESNGQSSTGVYVGAGGGGGSWGWNECEDELGAFGGDGGDGGLYGGGGGGGGPKSRFSSNCGPLEEEEVDQELFCVEASTIIKTSNGDIKAEDIKDGDSVLSWDSEKGAYEYAKVYNTRSAKFDSLLKITTESGKTIEISEDHGFYISLNEELFAKDLIEGESKLFVENGKQMVLETVTKIEKIEGDFTAYNFSVENTKSYISNGIISHNVETRGGGNYRTCIKINK